MTTKKHLPAHKSTPAFICANCGAVSLSHDGICKMQGKGTRADWCGSESGNAPKFCQNKVHTLRYKCKNCGQVAVNSELLCEPELLS
jgi:predicted RNA-binding Zn-ribbon protein involved in translation (DUF1610 family)